MANELGADSHAGDAPDAWSPRLHIADYRDLLQREPEILERITRTPRGGNLFMAHPLLALQDLGVDLSDRARAEILELHPELANLSPTAYEAVKASDAAQRVRYRLSGLFRRSTS